MMKVFQHANYDFIGYRKIAYVVTGIFIIPGLLFLLFTGLNYSIEFTGGTVVQVTTLRENIREGELRTALAGGGLEGTEIARFGGPNEFTVRARLAGDTTAGEDAAARVGVSVRAALTQAFGEDAYRVQRTEAVGPKVGSELRQKAIIAILLSFVATLVYLAFRFEWRFGVAAIVATAHDILATLAFIKYMDLEVSLVVVSAILTVIGYSLNDTIVIFDRVRENLRKYKREDFVGILNRSLNETLPRTVLTGGATILSLLALLILAGEVLRPFSWVMLFGVVTGTFSSLYIAAPVLLWIERKWPGKDARGVKAAVATKAAAPAKTPASV